MKENTAKKHSKSIVAAVTILSIASFLILVFLAVDNYLPMPDGNSLDPEFNDAEKFIKYGYPEIKYLSVQFLTLLTAILIFSLTFSEKIINYSQSTESVRAILITGWALLIFAIISDGIGLAYNAIALPTALADINGVDNNNSPGSAFYEPAFSSLKFILMSGAFFIGGLICIVSAGVASFIQQSKET